METQNNTDSENIKIYVDEQRLQQYVAAAIEMYKNAHPSWTEKELNDHIQRCVHDQVNEVTDELESEVSSFKENVEATYVPKSSIKFDENSYELTISDVKVPLSSINVDGVVEDIDVINSDLSNINIFLDTFAPMVGDAIENAVNAVNNGINIQGDDNIEVEIVNNNTLKANAYAQLLEAGADQSKRDKAIETLQRLSYSDPKSLVIRMKAALVKCIENNTSSITQLENKFNEYGYSVSDFIDNFYVLCNSVETSCNNIQNDITNLSTQITNNNNNIFNISSIIDEQGAQIYKYDTSISNIEKNVNYLSVIYTDCSGNIINISTYVNEMSGQVYIYDDRITNIENNIQNINTTINNLSTNPDISSQLSAYEQQARLSVEALWNEINNIRNDINNVHNNVVTNVQMIIDDNIQGLIPYIDNKHTCDNMSINKKLTTIDGIERQSFELNGWSDADSEEITVDLTSENTNLFGDGCDVLVRNRNGGDNRLVYKNINVYTPYNNLTSDISVITKQIVEIHGDIDDNASLIQSLTDDINSLSGNINQLGDYVNNKLSSDYWETYGDSSTNFGSSIGNSTRDTAIELDEHKLCGSWSASGFHVGAHSSVDGGYCMIGGESVVLGYGPAAGSLILNNGEARIETHRFDQPTLQIGDTIITEDQLKKLLALIN